MIYGYKCPVCHQPYTSIQRADRIDHSCVGCGHSPLHRDFSGIQLTRPMQEHWNQTVDQPISSQRQFNAALRQKSDEMSSYSGVEMDLQPLDPEQAKQGVTDQGLDATNRSRMAQGLKPINLDVL